MPQLFKKGTITAVQAGDMSITGITLVDGYDTYDVKIREIEDALGYTQQLYELDKAIPNAPNPSTYKTWLEGKRVAVNDARKAALIKYREVYEEEAAEGIPLKQCREDAFASAKAVAASKNKIIERKFDSSVASQLQHAESARLKTQVVGYVP